MYRYLRKIVPVAAIFALCMCSCNKDGDSDKSGGSKKAKEEKPSLMLKHDSPTCRQALKCCEAMVKLDKGKATPEDINLSCSGVGMADSDKTCEDFKKGYVMAIQSKGKEVPKDCK